MATKNINASWQFTKDAITVAEGYSVLTQGNWEALDLPHTWNGKDGQDGGNDYHRGTCYYVKNMKREEFGSEPITILSLTEQTLVHGFMLMEKKLDIMMVDTLHGE